MSKPAATLMKDLDPKQMLVSHLRAFFPLRPDEATVFTPAWFTRWSRDNTDGKLKTIYDKFSHVASLLVDLDENQRVPPKVVEVVLNIEQSGDFTHSHYAQLRKWIESAVQDDADLKEKRDEINVLVNSNPDILNLRPPKKLLKLFEKNYYHEASSKDLDILMASLQEIILVGGATAYASTVAVPALEAETCGEVSFPCYKGHRGRRFVVIKGKQIYFE